MSETSGKKSCNAGQPGATAGNGVQPNPPIAKTKPTAPGAISPREAIARAVGSSVSEWLDLSVAQGPRACNAVQPEATPCNRMQPIPRFGKTNPPRSTAPPTSTAGQSGGAERSASAAPRGSPRGEHLTPRQRAAARLLALGRTIPQTAAELNVARTTVWRWQTMEHFRAELEHLHRWLAGARIGTR